MSYDKKTILAAAEVARNYDEAHKQIGRAIANEIIRQLYPPPKKKSRPFQFSWKIKSWE